MEAKKVCLIYSSFSHFRAGSFWAELIVFLISGLVVDIFEFGTPNNLIEATFPLNIFLVQERILKCGTCFKMFSNLPYSKLINKTEIA